MDIIEIHWMNESLCNKNPLLYNCPLPDLYWMNAYDMLRYGRYELFMGSVFVNVVISVLLTYCIVHIGLYYFDKLAIEYWQNKKIKERMKQLPGVYK